MPTIMANTSRIWWPAAGPTLPTGLLHRARPAGRITYGSASNALRVKVAGAAGVPAGGVVAVSLNVTVVSREEIYERWMSFTEGLISTTHSDMHVTGRYLT